MKQIINKTGLVMIPGPQPKSWLLGFLPAKQLFCLGELTDKIGDIFRENEYAVIQFIEGKPKQLTMSNAEASEYLLKENEVGVKFGCFFINQA